jgi:hypothetical protein
MQGNERKTPCISFYFLCRIWTFQWVMANSNKKNRRTLNSPLGLCSAQDPGRHICARFSASRSAPYSVGEKMLSHISIYAEKLQALAVLAVGARERGAWGRTRVGERRRRQALGAQPQGADQQRTRTRTQCRNAYRDRPVSVFQASARVVVKIGLLPPIRA